MFIIVSIHTSNDIGENVNQSPTLYPPPGYLPFSKIMTEFGQIGETVIVIPKPYRTPQHNGWAQLGVVEVPNKLLQCL